MTADLEKQGYQRYRQGHLCLSGETLWTILNLNLLLISEVGLKCESCLERQQLWDNKERWLSEPHREKLHHLD